MIFKRGKPEPVRSKIRNLVWPRMGWWRTLQYYKHRTVRIPDTTYSVAAGLAVGCAVSFSPAIGTHFLQCVAFCKLIRANWLAAFLGTVFGNPYTFPVLWWMSGQTGHFILALFGLDSVFGSVSDEPFTWGEFWDAPVKTIIPMILGGFVCGVLSYPLFYYPFLYMIKGARAARRKRMERRAHKVAREVTGQKR